MEVGPVSSSEVCVCVYSVFLHSSNSAYLSAFTVLVTLVFIMLDCFVTLIMHNKLLDAPYKLQCWCMPSRLQYKACVSCVFSGEDLKTYIGL